MAGMENVWSWDIEVFSNCFTLSAVEIEDESKKKQFVIWNDVNDVKAVVEFLRSARGLIGYNSINFDYPIVHLCLLTKKLEELEKLTGHQLARRIYLFTQEMMQKEFPPRVKPVVPQRDTFRIWHFDNEAKATSLKWVQCALGWRNVEDTPFHHTEFIDKDKLATLLDYNMNDCLSNREFYLKRTIPKVKMRKALSDKYHVDLMNANDPKIGEEILLVKVAERKRMDVWDLKKMRTVREGGVRLKDIILPHVAFKSIEFESILERFKRMVITDTRKTADLMVPYDGMQYEFGFGGIHAARKNSVWEEADTCDVSSYYPNLSIQHGFYPEHMGEEFGIVYKEIYSERLKYPKGSPENEGLKLALNGSFGKSNSEYSALFDTRMTMQITINGQLLLAMLCEELTMSGAATIVMANTDGIECMVHNEEKYKSICAEWQVKNKLVLEMGKYKVLAIRDVNNYIAVKPDGKTKEKGAYEVDKEIHKDPSMRIVALAVRERFQKEIPITETIGNSQNIWDFMMAVRAKTGDFKMRLRDGNIIDTPRTMRYYISRSGNVLLKQTDKKFEKVHQKAYMTEANVFEDKPFADYQVNKKFYLDEAEKLLIGVNKNKNLLFV